MKLTPVTSSNIRSIGWDGRSGLTVVFASGATYNYEGVPRELYDALMAAPSKGSYLATQIKPRYKGVKQEKSAALGATAGQVQL